MIRPIPWQVKGLHWQLDEKSERLCGRRKCTTATEAATFAATIERLAATVQCVVEVNTEGEELSVVTIATPRGEAFALGLTACGL